MTSSFDRWATKEGPDFSPVEMDLTGWLQDDGDTYAPFDETKCSNCEAVIGAYLDVDPETSADVSAFTTFWIMDEVCETLFCEDCWIDATEEVE